MKDKADKPADYLQSATAAVIFGPEIAPETAVAPREPFAGRFEGDPSDPAVSAVDGAVSGGRAVHVRLRRPAGEDPEEPVGQGRLKGAKKRTGGESPSAPPQAMPKQCFAAREHRINKKVPGRSRALCLLRTCPPCRYVAQHIERCVGLA